MTGNLSPPGGHPDTSSVSAQTKATENVLSALLDAIREKECNRWWGGCVQRDAIHTCPARSRAVVPISVAPAQQPGPALRIGCCRAPAPSARHCQAATGNM